jgi:hypothetical protein
MYLLGRAESGLILCFKVFLVISKSQVAQFWANFCPRISHLKLVLQLKGKGIAIPVQFWTRSEGSRTLRIPDFNTIGTWKWWGCQPYARGAFTPRKYSWYLFLMGYAEAQLLRHCATNRKVAGSIPDGVIGIFHWHNPSGRTMASMPPKPLRTELQRLTVNGFVNDAFTSCKL